MNAPLERESLPDSLFGRNALHVFAHGIVPELRSQLVGMLPGMHTYAQRAVLLARPWDIVCVTEAVEDAYLDFLAELDLGPDPGNILATPDHTSREAVHALSGMLSHGRSARRSLSGPVERPPRLVLNPLLATRAEFRLAAALETRVGRPVHVLGGNLGAVRRANQKHRVRLKAIELEIPVADGEIVRLDARTVAGTFNPAPLESAIDRWRRRTGRAIVRGSRGASGSSTFVVDDRMTCHDAAELVRASWPGTICLVEELLDSTVSPNIQLFVPPGGGRVSCVSITDQLLDRNLSHVGNVYPSRARTLSSMIEYAGRLARWLQQGGFTGLAGFDFCEYLDPESGEPRCILAEVNPRTNGATYPAMAREMLNRNRAIRGGAKLEAFASRRIEIPASSFADLRKRYGGSFLDPAAGAGVLPYNTGCLPFGGIDVVAFGETRGEAFRVLEGFQNRIREPESERRSADRKGRDLAERASRAAVLR